MDIQLFLLFVFLLRTQSVWCYLYPYETPSRETKSLNGLWDFKISPDNDMSAGFRDKWFKYEFSKFGDYIKMPVPASFNDITTNSTIRDYVGWVWYQTSFYVPKRWLSDDIRVFIHFGSIHYFATVYLNGENIAMHEGGHLPFQVEIPHSALWSYNLLTIAVNNTLSPDTIPQGQLYYPNDTTRYPAGYKLYKHNFDYFDYAGINRPVTLCTTPEMYIKDIQINTDIKKETGIIHFSVKTSNQGTCVIRLYEGPQDTVAFSGSCQDKLLVNNARFWWPAGFCDKTPGHLYNFEVSLFDKDKSHVKDVYMMPVGIRKISWTNSSLLVNNMPVYLRGFGMHEDADIRGRGFDNVIMMRDMNLITWIGANSFRTSHYPYAEETLNQADALGLLVILEVPACSLWGFNEFVLSRHEAYLREMIQVYKNHPSIIMWSLANEPETNTEKANKYFGQLSSLARSLDSSRPVTFVTSQQSANDTAVHHMDVVCVNRYRAWYSDSGHTDLIPYQVISEMTAWHTKFNKPVLVTEYGAGAVPGQHVLPETMWSEEYQVVTFLKHFDAFNELRSKGIVAGEMLWNFIDFNTPQEYIRPGRCLKGLFTRERQPKYSAHVVRSRYLNLDDCSTITCDIKN